MKNKISIFIFTMILAIIASACMKTTTHDPLIGDDKKIDIKGSLMNGDMRSPNIEAGFWGKTVYVYFHDYMGECTVTVTNAQDSVLFREAILTYPITSVHYNMGDLPRGRYHLVITDGTDEADAWFNNFRFVAIKRRTL